MKYRFLFFTFFAPLIAFSQGKIEGSIIDKNSKQAISFSTIKVERENAIIDGAISDENGNFEMKLPFGIYKLIVESVGYNSFEKPLITLNKENPSIKIDPLTLEQSVQNLDEITVSAQRSSMEIKLDKRVFNVGKDLANVGGNATDVLINIPSISVDPEGQVKLRGSSNVRILIDGKPSGLTSTGLMGGLNSLQASMIERIEVITNPSARYEAEGMAGIINIILKKNQKNGFNGSLELITGYPVNNGIGANLNYRHKKINFFINLSSTYRNTPYYSKIDQKVFSGPDTTRLLKQKNNGNLIGFNTNITGGLDYFFNESSSLTGSYLFSKSKGKRNTFIHYQDYINSFDNLIDISNRTQDEDETEPKSEYSIVYKKDFSKKDHSLSISGRFLDNWENSDQTFTQKYFNSEGVILPEKNILQKSINDEYEKLYVAQLDYSKPIIKEGKFELGGRGSWRNMVNDYYVNNIDSLGNAIPIPNLKNYFTYKEEISAVYAIFGNTHNKFSYQAGLRAEWSNILTELRETNQINPRNYFNLFPSVHLTQKVNEENSLQFSYSRRIRRPLYNDLSPFMTFSDNRNFFSGNPNLNPEYSNVYEFTFLNNFEKGTLLASLYFRDSKDIIQSIRRLNPNGFSVTQPENLKGQKAFGLELTNQFQAQKWWKMDNNVNIFHAKIDASNIDSTYTRTTYSWFARHTSRFMFKKDFDVQFRANYEAKQKTAQGYRKALFFIDLACSKDILNKKATINFSVIDLFNTRKFRLLNEGPIFQTMSEMQFRPRQFNLTFNYRINQNKQNKKDIISD